MEGLEPTRLSAPDPKSGSATNYDTSAFVVAKLVKVDMLNKFRFRYPPETPVFYFWARSPLFPSK